jgi:NAD(P)-dependent dehydrogenase (short-subunit alcohol dehydrogenase family)
MLSIQAMQRTDWNGAVVVVTGAATGMGRALAEGLAERGAHVHAVDVDGDGLATLTEATTHRVDVTEAEAVNDLVDRVVRQDGRLDHMFNNAGIFAAGAFEELDDAAWRRIVDINLWGVVNGTRAAYAQMLRQGSGHIVNTASSAGVMPVAKGVAYAMTKHGVVGLSTSLRAEAARQGVKVSVVVPGLIDTGIFAKAQDLNGYDYQKSLDRLPFGKISPAQAATEIIAGVERNRQFITFPRYNRVIVGLNRMLPDLMSPVINR